MAQGGAGHLRAGGDVAGPGLDGRHRHQPVALTSYKATRDRETERKNEKLQKKTERERERERGEIKPRWTHLALLPPKSSSTISDICNTIPRSFIRTSGPTNFISHFTKSGLVVVV